jgi:hypothetical protein
MKVLVSGRMRASANARLMRESPSSNPSGTRDILLPRIQPTVLALEIKMATAFNYTYSYPFDSAVLEAAGGPAIRLATSLEESADDLFFDGRLRRPALVGKCLTVLSTIVRTRFYQPLDPMVLDPVVTSGGGFLRFEGFSSCCGAYARVDLSPDAFDVDLRGKGTTNVDFNDAMRAALRRMDDDQDARLQVGGDGVTTTPVFLATALADMGGAAPAGAAAGDPACNTNA